MSDPIEKTGNTRLLTAFVWSIAMVGTLLLFMAIGIWIYTSGILAREQALVSRVLPELDQAYELTSVSAGFQSRARSLTGAQSIEALEANRQGMLTIIAKTDEAIASMAELDTAIKSNLSKAAADVRDVVEKLSEVRARQLTLEKEIEASTKHLLSSTSTLENLIQRKIVVLTDNQLSQSSPIYANESGRNTNEGQVENLFDSLGSFEAISLAIQDYLLLNQDLVALEGVIEQVELLTSPEAIVQAAQKRELLINAMVSRIIYLKASTTKQEVLSQLTDLRNAMHGDLNLFGLQKMSLALATDQQTQSELLEQYTNRILLLTDEVRDTSRETVTLVTNATLRGLSNYRTVVFIVSVITLLMLAWMCYGLLYRRTVLPLVELSSQLETVGTDNFVREPQPYSTIEMANLSDAIGELDEAHRNMRAKDRLLSARNDELIRVNENLQQFAHIASHDLQEPLRKLRQFSDLLVEDYEPVLDEDGLFFLNAIKTSSARMSLMIKDTLTYSKAGLNDQTVVRIDLNNLLKSLLVDLELAVKETNASIKIQPLPDVLANRTGMDQLFRNLLLNALKYHKSDTDLKIDISAEKDEAAQSLTIAVSDNGIGMSEQDLQRIFEPFMRLHNDTTKGTGLGLAICNKVCDAHNWHISVKSTESVGSRFLITLPLTSVFDT